MAVGTGVTITKTLPVLVGSATEVATINICVHHSEPKSGGVVGAVYFPFASMLPQFRGAQPKDPTLQVTPLFVESFRNVASNCCDRPAWRTIVLPYTTTKGGAGVTVTTTAL